jgi:hypothetical protein
MDTAEQQALNKKDLKKPVPRRKAVKLDKVMSTLFDATHGSLVNLMNGLFHRDYSPDEVEVVAESGKFVKEDFSVIEGDMFLRVEERSHLAADGKPHKFHLEFQTRPDGLMALRLFEYDFQKAKKDAMRRKTGDGVMDCTCQSRLWCTSNTTSRSQILIL